MKAPVATSVILACVISFTAIAYESPEGDVSPDIVSSSDNIVVTFRRTDPELPGQGSQIKAVYDREGRMIEVEPMPISELRPDNTGAVALFTYDGKSFTVMNGELKEVAGTKLSDRPISWNRDISNIHQFLVDKDVVFLLGDRVSPAQGQALTDALREVPLTIHQVARDGGALRATYTVGNPTRVWGVWPQTSNLSMRGTSLYLVWMSESPNTSARNWGQAQMMLTAINLETKEAKSHVIGEANWDSALSLAGEPDRLVIAYHKRFNPWSPNRVYVHVEEIGVAK